jgi:uncharacterized protein involved in outer membrane biogenesis
MDADVRYRAESVRAKKISIRAIDLGVRLNQGVMTLDPVSLVLPQGKLVASVRVDGSHEVPDVTIDTRLTAVRLSQFHTREGPPPLDGILVGRAMLHGHGKSIHEVASTAEGTVTAVIPHGEIRKALPELTGINVARGLGLLLTKNQDKAALRCGVANFKGAGGVFAAENIIFDTENVLITGKGEVDLGSEILDLSVNGEPKKLRWVRLKTPITIGGTLRKPQVGVKPGNAVGQAAAAAALGALATPLAAVLAFIDPGLAKDADCGALLAEAKRHGAPFKEAQRPTKARSIS